MKISTPRLNQIFANFQNCRILVIGDVLADEYIYGLTSRLSREAPVLILKYQKAELRPGGAGNAALNVRALTAQVTALSVVGKDIYGKEVVDILAREGIEVNGIVFDKNHPTPVKTRIMAGGAHTTQQQVIRIDKEPEGSLSSLARKKLLEELRDKITKIDGILISDYGYEVINGIEPASNYSLIKELNDLSQKKPIPIAVDSRYKLDQFHNATVLAPSEKELEVLAGRTFGNDKNSLVKYARSILQRTQCKLILITRGREGLALIEKGSKAQFIPIFGSDQIADPTGAGDSVIATFITALCSQATPLEAALLANCAGSVSVSKSGTCVVLKSELYETALKYLAK